MLAQAVDHIPKKWGNVRGIFIKTPSSVALPLWQTAPENKSTKIEQPVATVASGAAAGGKVGGTAGGKKDPPSKAPVATAVGAKVKTVVSPVEASAAVAVAPEAKKKALSSGKVPAVGGVKSKKIKV